MTVIRKDDKPEDLGVIIYNRAAHQTNPVSAAKLIEAIMLAEEQVNFPCDKES